MVDVTPINVAEAVIEPFWDRNLSGLDEWTVDAEPESGGTVSEPHARAEIEWESAPADGPVLELERDLNIDCSDYERLLLSAVLPEGCVCEVTMDTDVGRRRHETTPSDGDKREYAVPLEDAREIHRLVLSFHPEGTQRDLGWLNWIGLQDPDRLEEYLAQWDRFDSRWEDHLRPPDYEPEFEPTTSLLLDDADVEALREQYANDESDLLDDVVSAARAAAADHPPEERVTDFLSGGDDRFTRDRDVEGTLGWRSGPGEAIAAAASGLLLEDAHLQRLAARYAMSIAMADRWDEGFVSRFPGSAWSHRSFAPSVVLQSVALVYDLAGEWFTEAGEEYLRRKMTEDGLDGITYDTWRWDYIFENNQLAWFSHGRLAALATLEAAWPRVEPYTDIAHEELRESVEDIVLDDGGFVEGPTYLSTVVGHGGRGFYYYAQARDESFEDVLPAAFERTESFGAALASTDANQDVIPICDGSPHVSQAVLAILSTLDPDGAWSRILDGAMDRAGGTANDVFTANLLRDLDRPDDLPDLPALVRLPEMGVVSSVREHAGDPVKLFLMGNRAGAGHTHEDKGSFVLEYAGQTFAMDPGTASYDGTLSHHLKRCERHNMLVPVGTDGRPHPERPLPHGVKPTASGDETTFDASIDAAPGWDAYEQWERTWESPDPGTLRITDEWALVEGDGVEFYWQVPADIEVTANDDEVVLTGRRGEVILEPPANATVRIDEVPMSADTATRVAVRYDASDGEATVTARLETIDG